MSDAEAIVRVLRAAAAEDARWHEIDCVCLVCRAADGDLNATALLLEEMEDRQRFRDLPSTQEPPRDTAPGRRLDA